ncbi:MAG: hypothetical protein QW776_00535 [Candidatus Nitrosocaldus sp.]
MSEKRNSNGDHKGIDPDLKRKIYTLLLKNLTSEEIAAALNIHPRVVSKSIASILAGIDRKGKGYEDTARTLHREYRFCIDGLNEVLRELWLLFHSSDDEGIKIRVLKMIMDLYEARIRMLEDGEVAAKVRELVNILEDEAKETDGQG